MFFNTFLTYPLGFFQRICDLNPTVYGLIKPVHLSMKG